MSEQELLNRITTDREIFGGKPIIRGHRVAVEHVLGMLATGDTYESLLAGYPFLELEDIQACLLYAQTLVQKIQPEPSLTKLKELVPEVVKQAPYIKLIVLFGSRAKGTATPSSDWDFAILYNEEIRHEYENDGFNHFRIWSILEQVFDIRNNKVDIVDLNHCSPAIAYHVSQDGQAIYEREEGEFQRFQRKAWKIFADTQKFRDMRRRSIEIKLEKLGA